MIGTSLPEYLFIRVCIFATRYFVPLIIAALVLTLIVDHDATGLTLFLEIITIAEVAFYVLVYIPKYRALQKPARHPPVATRAERQALFDRGHATIADPEDYLTKWFNGAALETIRRENVKEFFCWAFFNRAAWGPEDEAELEGYADKVEELLGRKLAPGVGSARPIKLTLDPVIIYHRPLVWYMIVSLVDAITYLRLLAHGFRFYRLRLARLPTVFPLRPITLFSRRTTPSDTLSYFLRPHTARTRLPIVFVHGIGVGLYPYVPFLAALNRPGHAGADDDGQIGVLAVELMPISARLTGAMPSHATLTRDLLAILDRHGWERVVLAGNSYGSTLVAPLLRDPAAAARIAALVLVDPVALLLHEPSVAYNFVRRAPRTAPEWQVHYFSATDALVAHTLARRFFWAQCVLWKEELTRNRQRRATVALGGRDCIVDAPAVGRYLAGAARGYERFVADGGDEAGPAPADEADEWRSLAWRGEGLDVLWFAPCDHAQIFDKKVNYMRIVEVLRSYSAGVDQ